MPRWRHVPWGLIRLSVEETQKAGRVLVTNVELGLLWWGISYLYIQMTLSCPSFYILNLQSNRTTFDFKNPVDIARAIVTLFHITERVWPNLEGGGTLANSMRQFNAIMDVHCTMGYFFVVVSIRSNTLIGADKSEKETKLPLDLHMTIFWCYFWLKKIVNFCCILLIENTP